MRKVDLPTLKKSAAAYLGRYASSSANLAAVLRRRVHRWCREHDRDPAEFHPAIAETVAFCQQHGLVDDAAFADMRTASLRHRGWPERRIRAGLAQKGIAADLIDQAIENDEGDDETAALRFAKRRRLGPWRTGDRSAKRDKDIAAMMRSGFTPRLARATIDGEADEGAL